MAGPLGAPITGFSAAPSGTVGIQRSRVNHALATPSIEISTKAGTIICHRKRRSDRAGAGEATSSSAAVGALARLGD